jgi:hypothetical protein
MSGYVSTGYVQPHYVTSAALLIVVKFPTPPPGELPSASPERGRITLEASPPSTSFPRGPYGMVTALVLTTHAGDRIFSQMAVDPVYGVPPSVGRYVTLLDLDAITLSQGGSGSTLVTRINSLELPSFSFVADNSDGFWSQLIASEYLLCMSISVYLDLGDGIHIFGGRGEIQEIELSRKTVRIRVGA